MEDDDQWPQRMQPGQQRGRRGQCGEDQQEPHRGQRQLHQRVDGRVVRAREQKQRGRHRPQGEDGQDGPEEPGQPGGQPAAVGLAARTGRRVPTRGDVAADQEEHGEGLEGPGDRGQPGHVLQRAGRVQAGAIGDQGRHQPVPEHHPEDGEGAQGVHGPVPLLGGGGVDAGDGGTQGAARGRRGRVSHGSPPWSPPGRSGSGSSGRGSRCRSSRCGRRLRRRRPGRRSPGRPGRCRSRRWCRTGRR